MSKVISKDGTVITYGEKGTGPVVILVLGALNKRGSGKKLADLLANDFTVVSYDRRGRGDSTDTQPYSVEREIDDIEAIVDDLGVNVSLYGHSSGAILSLLVAQKLAKKITNLALYEVPFNDSPEALKIAQKYQHTLQQLLIDDKRGDAVALFVKSVGVSDKQVSAMRGLPMWKGLTSMAPTLAYDTIQMMQKYPTIDTHGISTRTLIMYGSASPDFMKITAQKLSDALPNAVIQALDGQVHDVKASVLAPQLAEFLN